VVGRQSKSHCKQPEVKCLQRFLWAKKTDESRFFCGLSEGFTGGRFKQILPKTLLAGLFLVESRMERQREEIVGASSTNKPPSRERSVHLSQEDAPVPV
jgi:hypothetical protein